MNRRILLLTNPGNKNNYAPQVDEVIKRYEVFFKSPYGGAWEENEFITMPNDLDGGQQLDWLRHMIEELDSSCDYSIIVFIGHGASCDKRDCVQLSGGKIIPITNFNGNIDSVKRTIIIDSCRNDNKSLKDAIEEERWFSGGEFAEENLIREFYNELILGLEPNIELIQSTSLNNSAFLTPSGSFFSDALFDIVKINKEYWGQCALNNRNGQFVFSVKELFEEVKKIMINKGQEPQYTSSSKTNGSFPFFVDWKPITKML